MHDLVIGAALMFGTAVPVSGTPAITVEGLDTTLAAATLPDPAPPIDEILVTAPATPQPFEQVASDELAEQRGGATYIVNNQTLLGVVQGNVIGGDYVAGQVALSDNALSNFNGLLAISINTGLQSNIISGMAVTINLSE